MAMAFSPDGRYLAVLGGDAATEVRIYDWADADAEGAVATSVLDAPRASSSSTASTQPSSPPASAA